MSPMVDSLNTCMFVTFTVSVSSSTGTLSFKTSALSVLAGNLAASLQEGVIDDEIENFDDCYDTSSKKETHVSSNVT